jgi:RluA family pseudouridine synthase
MRGQPRPAAQRRLGGIVILYEDRDILVVDKPAGLLTIGTETEKSRTAYWILTDYVRKGCARSRKRLFIVHRLDRDVSGVLVLAKTVTAKLRLQERWQDNAKKYLAVVHGRLASREGTLTSYLAENQARVVYSTSDPARGRLSRTAYTVLREAGAFSLLDITLLTGRRNQIRVQFADEGHPVAGDRKYGRRNDGLKRLALHARSLTLNHPASGRRLRFEAAIPAHFARWIGASGAGHLPA